MKKYIKKVYLSIVLIVLSILTMVATTYAWVGLLTNSTFNEFTINLREYDDPDAADYGIQLSLTGEQGSFRDVIDQVDLRRQILKNLGYTVDTASENTINKLFNDYKMDQCTMSLTNVNQLGQFKNMFNQPTNNYFWFDLYISVYKIFRNGETIDDYDSSNRINIYLRDHILSAYNPLDSESINGIYNFNVVNTITFPNQQGYFNGNPILGNSLPNSLTPGAKVEKDIVYRSNAANACRVALQKFISVPKGHPELYNHGGSIYRGVKIYQSGSMYPTYDPVENIYDFGGVLPLDYNFSRLYYNSLHSGSSVESKFSASEIDEILNRGDVIFTDNAESEDNHIVTVEDDVTTNNMIRFRVYFWFEGWDADCFDVLDRKTVEMALYFSTKAEDI